MLNVEDATNILNRNLPNRIVKAVISYNGLFVFRAEDDNDPLEGNQDPFFSVDQTTGELKEFSVLTDGNFADISKLFIEANQGGE